MIYLIIGNILAFIGSLFMVAAGIAKDNKKVIIIQTIQIIMFIFSNLVLGGMTGVIINSISCIRNILAYKGKLNNVLTTILLIFIIMFTVMFNNLGIIGYLPLVGTIIFTIFINNENPVKFKLSLAFSILMWLIYDIYIKSYSSAIFDFLSLSTGLISIYQIKRLARKKV